MNHVDSDSVSAFRKNAPLGPLHIPLQEKVKAALTAAPVPLILIGAGLFLKGTFGALFVVAGVVLCVVIYERISRTLRLVLRGELTTGVLKSIEETISDHGPSQYKYTFSYTAGDGSEHRHVLRGVPLGWRGCRFEENRQYDIIYDPKQPSKGLLVAELPKIRIEENGTVRIGSDVGAVIGALVSVAVIGARVYMYFGFGR